ncbi:MAG: hypothetical protein GX493_00920 [Firmicutes bacterium]|nr:hypothetical protein [Bacillota bacterium]
MRFFRSLVFFLVILPGILLSGWLNPLNALELTVSPVRIELRLLPEKPVEGTVLISSRSDEEVKVRVSVGDWTLRPDGQVEFLPAGQQPRSLNRWITVYPLEFTVGRGKGQHVRYRVKPPAEITGTYWGMLFFTTVPPTAGGAEKGVSISTASRIAVPIYATTERGGARDGRVTGVKANWVGEKGLLKLGATFANLGNTLVRLKGRFEVKEALRDKLVAKVDFEDLAVLPGGTREILAEWTGKLDPGIYVVVALVDYGGRNLVAGQKTFKVAGK